MKDDLQTYLKQHFPVQDIFQKNDANSDKASFNRYTVDFRKKIVLELLKISPYLCMVLFASSFAVSNLPVEGVQAFYTSYDWIIDALFIVSVSGLIGYGTNYIAIRMLFRPVVRRPIWGQGLIPAQKDRIIFTLAKGMHTHILNQDLIREKVEESGLITRINDILISGTIGVLKDEDLKALIKKLIYEGLEDYAQQDKIRNDIYQIIDSRLEENMNIGVKKFLLQTYKRYNKEEYDGVITNVVKDIPKVAVEVLEKLDEDIDRLVAFLRLNRKASEQMITQLFLDIINRIDIVGLLQKQMEHFDETRLEKMIWEATNEQLLYIQYLGTVLGILGGLIIWQPTTMIIGFVAIFGLLFLLDWLLNRLKTRA
ncbi:MAG: DUF445 family protein [Bacteroidota bacterium]